MTWRHSSANTTATRAVVGEFLGRRTLMSGVVLTALAFWGGRHFSVGDNIRVAAVGVLLTTAGTMSSIAWTWVLSERWHTLMTLPVRAKDLARAIYLVGSFVALVEAIVPATVFIAISSASPHMTVLPLFCIGIGSAPLIVLFWGGASPRHQLFSGASLIIILFASVEWSTTTAAIIATSIALLCVFLGLEVGHDKTHRSRRHATITSHLVLGELLTSRMTQINSLVLLGSGIAINIMLHRHDSTLLLGFILAVSNTPLNSYFSRNPSTWQAIRMSPRPWLFYCCFGAQLAFYYILGAVVVTLAPGRPGAHTPSSLLAAVLAAVGAAAAATIMEMHWPFTHWKSEREVLKHPRKYVPGIIAFIVAGAGWFLSIA